MNTPLQEAIELRRSIYPLQPKSPVSDEKLREIVKTAILHTPSTFNSQSTRLVILLKEEHGKFWDIVRDVLKPIVPAEKWESSTAKRIAMFRNAYGSILFYEDPSTVKGMQEKFPEFADRFPQWSEHTSGMHQYVLWTALETEGFGCNLQHYNPLVDERVSDTWNVPKGWTLNAQLVFGVPADGARAKLPEKTVEPIEKRVFFHGE